MEFINITELNINKCYTSRLIQVLQNTGTSNTLSGRLPEPPEAFNQGGAEPASISVSTKDSCRLSRPFST